jgi:hypothetical protein
MKISLKFLLPLLILAPIFVSLGGCGCGFSCSGGGNNDNNPAKLTLGFSDSIPEDLTEVVIKVNSITFRRSGAEDVKIETFTLKIGTQEFIDVSDFQVNLLDYRGLEQLTVIENRELDTGLYSEVSIEILGDDMNSSYVIEEGGDTQTELNVPGGSLDLKDVRLISGSQTVTVEFGLAQALVFQSSTDPYLLTTTGIRTENNDEAASLSGQIDSTLFNTVSTCSEKSDPLKGNRIYLYKGWDLLSDGLADVFTTDSSPPAPDDAIAPFAVASIEFIKFTDTWQYSFGFIPAGDYTMAFACDTETDDSVKYNGLTIPLPENQVYEISLAEGDKAQCNLSESASC